MRFAQRQIGHGADDDGARLHALLFRLGQLRQQARGVQAEGRVRVQLRHDVVVVGVKPLGHFTGGDFALCRAMRVIAMAVVLTIFR